MKRKKKIIIGVIAVVAVMVIGLPLIAAAVLADTEALKGLIYTLKANIQAFTEFLEYLAKGSTYEAPELLPE